MSVISSVWIAATVRGRVVFVLGAALAFGGLAWHYPVLAALGGCLVVLVLAELVAVLGSRGATVTREVEPRVVRRHSHCGGRLTVDGRRRRGLVRLDVADQVGGRLIPVRLPDQRATSDDPGDAAPVPTSVGYTIPTPRRGLVDVGPVRVRLVGLTGMAAHADDAGGVDQVRVLPREIAVGSMMRGHRRSPAGNDDSFELGGTDLVGLHHYAMGDDLRRLHWATSARTGSLMVREDAEPSEPHVCVVLDDRAAAYGARTGAHAAVRVGAGAGSGAGGAADDLFEEAVELASALCRVAGSRGHPLRLETTSAREHVTVPGSTSRTPLREQQDLDWLLAEIDLSAQDWALDLGRDLDVAVVVTGPGCDVREVGLALGPAAVRVIAVVEPAPLVSTLHENGLLVLRGATSTSLAMLWDAAAER